MSTPIPPYWLEAKKVLSARDPVMKKIIDAHPPTAAIQSRGNNFETLLRSIVGQQLSVKAAQTIWLRVQSLCDCTSPRSVLRAKPEQLRKAGLSQRKTEYVQDLASHFESKKVDPAKWPDMDDEELIEELCTVRGIGRWTAEMFLMFHLLRADIFPVDDLGIRRAISKNYLKRYPPSDKTMHKIADAWKPWRTVATWYLWRSLEPTSVI